MPRRAATPAEMQEPASSSGWPSAAEGMEAPLLGGSANGRGFFRGDAGADDSSVEEPLQPWVGLLAAAAAIATLLAVLFWPGFKFDTDDAEFRAKAALSLLALPAACLLERYLRFKWRRQWRRGHVRFYRRTRMLLSAPVLTTAFADAAIALLALWPDALAGIGLGRVRALQLLVVTEMSVAFGLMAAIGVAAMRHARASSTPDAAASLGGTEKLLRGLGGAAPGGASALLLPISQPQAAVGAASGGENGSGGAFGRAAFERQAELIHYLQSSQRALCKRVLALQAQVEGAGAEAGRDAAAAELDEVERRLARAEAALGETRGEHDALAGELRAAKEAAAKREDEAAAAAELAVEAQAENERVREMLGEWSRHCAMLEARLQAYAGTPPPLPAGAQGETAAP